MRLPAHRATTAQLGAAYPFMAEAPLGCPGPCIGRDLLSGAFAYDPFALYRGGALTDPNVVVLGQIGRGKSALVKTYLWRQSQRGARVFVVDPKGEYGPLGHRWGVTPLRLTPGGALRLNPLDDPGPDGPERSRRRAALLSSLAEACLRRPLRPAERAALDAALAATEADTAGNPVLPGVVGRLLDPDREAAAAVGTTTAGLAGDGRDVALELRRLVAGDLRGMFDGPTSPGVRTGDRFSVLDLSAVYGSAALGVIMTCAAAWVQAGLGPAAGDSARILVVDEAWAILGHPATADWLRASWKLARAWGVSNMAVVHRLSDLAAAGPPGSREAALAEGLLADSQTRIVYAQPPGETDAARRALGLTDTEADLVGRLRRGVALWKVGSRSYLVEHRVAPGEAALVDTDGAMTAGAR